MDCDCSAWTSMLPELLIMMIPHGPWQAAQSAPWSPSHHLRRSRSLQQDPSTDGPPGSGQLFVQSLVFFGILVAMFLTIWIMMRIICRMVYTVSRPPEPPQSVPSLPTRFQSPRSPPVGTNDRPFTDQEMQVLQNWGIVVTPGGRPSLVVVRNGVPTSPLSRLHVQIHEAQRRAFFEGILLEETYDDEAPPDEAAATADQKDEDDPDKTCCPICLEVFQRGDRLSYSINQQCHHKFHRSCILDWLVCDETCPCCRQSFLEVSEASPPSDKIRVDDEASHGRTDRPPSESLTPWVADAPPTEIETGPPPAAEEPSRSEGHE